MHIGALFDSGHFSHLGRVRRLRPVGDAPMDELLVRDSVRVGSVIDEDGVFLWCDVHVNDHLVGTSVNTDVPRGIYRSVERVVTKVGEVVSKQVLGIDIEVVGEVRQAVVVDASSDNTLAVMNIIVMN